MSKCKGSGRCRRQLEALYGQVWDVKELARDFTITSIIGDCVIVRRRVDGVVGRLTFQSEPTLYFNFQPATLDD